MEHNGGTHIKLGIFVIAGLGFLVITLYMIGKNQNILGSNVLIRARFENIQGLTPGNNVRYAGVQAGTVKSIEIVDDTIIEVTMMIRKKMLQHIHKNSVASIGTDGLVGNKIINITPAGINAKVIEEGDILPIKEVIDTDELLQNLARTSIDLPVISARLKSVITKFNESETLWKILEDESLPMELKSTVMNAKLATAGAAHTAKILSLLAADLEQGKGSLGMLLRDTQFVSRLNDAAEKIKNVAVNADRLSVSLREKVDIIDNQIHGGKGAVTALLKDSSMASSLQQSLANIERGTGGFNEVMDALKHNFLVRGYFRKQEKKKKKNL